MERTRTLDKGLIGETLRRADGKITLDAIHIPDMLRCSDRRLVSNGEDGGIECQEDVDVDVLGELDIDIDIDMDVDVHVGGEGEGGTDEIDFCLNVLEEGGHIGTEEQKKVLRTLFRLSRKDRTAAAILERGGQETLLKILLAGVGSVCESNAKEIEFLDACAAVLQCLIVLASSALPLWQCFDGFEPSHSLNALIDTILQSDLSQRARSMLLHVLLVIFENMGGPLEAALARIEEVGVETCTLQIGCNISPRILQPCSTFGEALYRLLLPKMQPYIRALVHAITCGTNASTIAAKLLLLTLSHFLWNERIQGSYFCGILYHSDAAADLVEWMNSCKAPEEEAGIGALHYILRLLLRVFKGRHQRIKHTLIKLKTYDSLRDKLMPLKDDALALHALEFLAIQVRYLGPRWRKKNMECVTLIAKNVRDRGPYWLVLPISTSERGEGEERKMHGKWNAHHYLRPPSPLFSLRPCARVYT